MTRLQLAGPSYALRNRSADVQRCINWIPVQIESGTGKGGSQSYLKQVPGKAVLATAAGAWRGLWVAGGVLYGVAGSSLYSIDADYALTALATSIPGTDPVGMADNNTQLAITTGSALYVVELSTGAVSTLGAGDGFLGSTRVDVIDGYGVFGTPDGWTLFTTGQQDFTSINPLDFGSAESSTGNIVAHIVKHREVLVLKDRTGEIWFDAGNLDGIPLSPNTGATIEAGCVAPHSLQKIAGMAMWLGRDDRGTGIVFGMQAYIPARISTHALEEALAGLTEAQIAAASAYTYHQEGLSFYVLNVPGLSTTWVYEVAAGIWHERAEFMNGEYLPDYGRCHAYAYGTHVVGGADGNLYSLDPELNTSGTRHLVRERITPHNADPGNNRVRFGSLQVDGQVGAGLSGSDAKIMLRYSDDGGNMWTGWRQLSLGKIGEYRARARTTMLGAGRDRVWNIRVTDDVKFEPSAIVVDER